MNKNDLRTKAFETVDQKGFKSDDSRRKLVIAIFVVVALILAAFATLMIGKVIGQIDFPTSPDTPNNNGSITYVPKDAGDVKVGNLLFINDRFQYSFSGDFSNMINVKNFQRDSQNASKTEINGSYTYSLTADRIVLEENTLEAFNKMILDYCNTISLAGASQNSASNLVIAWGGYSEQTKGEYESDISGIGKDYYDHALGTTVTLKTYSPSEAVTDSVLKNRFAWIYENAHKYGFILRFPEECKGHTGFDGSDRVHLRYVGIEHAYYIHHNNICFEEYLEILRDHSYDNPLTFTADNGNTYQVYYVAYSGNPTSVPVPKNNHSTISGDNMNGFIVTVENIIE